MSYYYFCNSDDSDDDYEDDMKHCFISPVDVTKTYTKSLTKEKQNFKQESFNFIIAKKLLNPL